MSIMDGAGSEYTSDGTGLINPTVGVGTGAATLTDARAGVDECCSVSGVTKSWLIQVASGTFDDSLVGAGIRTESKMYARPFLASAWRETTVLPLPFFMYVLPLS